MDPIVNFASMATILTPFSRLGPTGKKLVAGYGAGKVSMLLVDINCRKALSVYMSYGFFFDDFSVSKLHSVPAHMPSRLRALAESLPAASSSFPGNDVSAPLESLT